MSNTRTLKASDFMISGGSTILRTGSPFVLIMVFAHLLAVETFGVFAYYYTIGGFLLIILDFGFNIKMVRDIAKSSKNVSSITSNATLTKAILLLPTLLTCYIMLKINLIQRDELSIALLIFIGLIAYSFANHFTIPFRGMGHYHVELYYFAVCEVIVLAGTLGTLLFTNDLHTSLIVFSNLRILAALFGALLYAHHYGFVRPQWSCLKELRENTPFAVHFALGTLYFTIDTAILRYFVNEYDIGLYQASMRLALVVTLPVALTNTVLLPHFTRLLGKEDEFKKQIIKYNRLFMLFGLMASWGLFLLFDRLVSLLFGAKFMSINTLILPILCIVALRYISSIWGILLTVRGKQTLRVSALAVTFIIVLIGNYFIAPYYGILGAAYIMAGAHFTLLILYAYFVHREFNSTFIL